MSDNFASYIRAALNEYGKVNGNLPSLIVVYRDGVGDGTIPYVYDSEVNQIKKALNNACASDVGPPKLVYIIVSKRVNIRFFYKKSTYENPLPGTVVDTQVTRKDRFEFYLVSQLVKQGTINPTSYNIIEDQTGWVPQNHQILAYKLTHLYFNYSVSDC